MQYYNPNPIVLYVPLRGSKRPGLLPRVADYMEDVDYPDSSFSLAHDTSEIECLKAEVLVHSARASNLHTRLLHALDALDEAQRNHAQELRDWEKKYVRLERRYHRQTAALHTCASEKDDLKASVLELVEKVEQSNDIRSWPFNRLQLTRSAGSPRQIEPKVRHSPTQEHLSYAGAIIERLRRERDEERVEHALTREALQSRIDALEARLARRETELEYYNTHAAHRSPVISERNRAENTGSTSSKGLVDAIPQAMTNEDIIRMLDTTAARNRTLEVEIKTLFKRLHEARSLPNSTEAASPPLPPGHQTPVHSPPSRGLEGAGVRTATASGCSDVFSPRSNRDASELNSSSFFTPTRLPKSTPLSDGGDGHHGDDDVLMPDSWTSLLPTTPTRDEASAQGDINSVVGAGDGHSPPDLELLGVVHDPRRKSAIIAGLDTELAELTAQIDAFRLERESLTRMVDARRVHRETQCCDQSDGNSSGSGSRSVRRTCDDPSVGSSPEGDSVNAVGPFEHGHDQDHIEEDDLGTLEHRLSVVEGDCIRLRHELSECRTSAETREKELLAEVQDLQRRVEELGMRCRTITPRTPLLSDETERALCASRGTEKEAQYEPTATLIPDTTKIEENHFCEPIGLDDGDVDRLLDVIDGEVSMVLATPLLPSSFSLDRDSSDEVVDRDGISYDEERNEEDMELEGMSEGEDVEERTSCGDAPDSFRSPSGDQRPRDHHERESDAM